MPSFAGVKRRLRQTFHPTAIDQFMKDVQGWTSYEQLEFLVQNVRALPDNAIIVEVGVWHGRSALAMAEACRGTNKHVYAIDPWQSYTAEVDGAGYDAAEIVKNSGLESFDQVLEIFKNHIQRFELGPYMTPIQAMGVDVARTWDRGPVSFVFIDASHTYQAVSADLESWSTLSPTICGDDWDFTGDGTERSVEAAVRDFLSRHEEWRLSLPIANTWMLRR